MTPVDLNAIRARVHKDRKAVESIRGSSITPDPKLLQNLTDTESLILEVERVQGASDKYRIAVNEAVRAILEASGELRK